MENKTLTFVDRLNDIVERINFTDKLDMSKLPDLEKAKETVAQLKTDFKNLCDESPLIQKMIGFTSAFMGMDLKEELDKMTSIIDEKIAEVKKTAKNVAETYKEVKDKSEGDQCSCYFCDCDNCPDCDGELIEDYPMTGEDVARELDNEYFKDVEQSTPGQKKTLCNLIAEFINERYGYLNYNDEDDAADIEDLCNTLYEFADYTLNRE